MLIYQKDTYADKNKGAFLANLINHVMLLLECILNEAKKQDIPIHGCS